MRITNEDMENLKKLGLNSYEARAYILLTSLISATADEISLQSKIPKSKVYNALKSLAKKGYIEIEQERPLVYNAKSPAEVLKKQKESLNKEIDDLTEKLNSNYQTKIKQNPAPIWKINGIKNIIEKEIELINRSQQSISMRIGFLFDDELDQLLNALKKKKVKPNVVVPGEWKGKSEIIDKFEKTGVNLYFKNIPAVKMMICDNQEMLHIYAKFDDENNVIPDSAISIWNQYEEVANHYQKNFEKQIRR